MNAFTPTSPYRAIDLCPSSYDFETEERPSYSLRPDLVGLVKLLEAHEIGLKALLPYQGLNRLDGSGRNIDHATFAASNEG
jgi:hypothetical protein